MTNGEKFAFEEIGKLVAWLGESEDVCWALADQFLMLLLDAGYTIVSIPGG